MKYILSAIIILVQLGCASYFKRKSCEEINWYDYGQKVAMSGKRLESDQFLSECRKVEAEIGETKLDLGYKSGRDRYCTMDEIYNTGRSGHPFSYELCDHLSRQKVKDRHMDGVLVFCKPDNAYAFGARGEVYEKVCPEDKEVAFLKEYSRGRKLFLESAIKSNEVEVAELEKNIERLQRDKDFKAMSLARLPAVPIAAKNQQQPGDSKSVVVDLYKQERERLQNDLDSLVSQIRAAQSKRENLKEENREMRKEALSLSAS
jgi:hypothetical protein